MPQPEAYPNLYQVAEQIRTLSKFQKKAVNRLLETADVRYLAFAEDLVRRMLAVADHADGHAYLARTYLWYTKTIRIEEMYFSKENKYRHENYDEVYQKVYGRDDYMFDYVVGLGMTQIFWPNHWDIFRFFMDAFLPAVREARTGAEIGVGHGLFHAQFLKECPLAHSTLLDVSPVSLDMTRRMIGATGLDPERAVPVLTDVQRNIPLADGSLDALLMGEIIEHIQEGEAVMTAMAAKMAPQGRCYFSTAANSPAEDHILLFRSVADIRSFLDRCGWEVLREHTGTVNGMSLEAAEEGGHNINYAAVLAAK